jgi:hypothetical protein
MMIPVSTTRPAGRSLYAFPEGYSLADWTTYRVQLSESSSPNTGYYTAELDDSLSSLWRLFDGQSQPNSWSEAIEYFPLHSNNGGSGAYIVTIEVTSESLPVRGAIVTVEQDDSTILRVVTKSLGGAAVALDPGDYTATVVATGFTSIIEAPFSVSEDRTLPFSLELAPLEPPTAAETCRVRLQATRGSFGEKVRVVITTSSVGRDQDLAFLNIAFDGETNEQGLLLVDLPWSSNPGVGPYRFRLIDLVNGKTLHDRTCLVPDEASANYEDLE